MNIRPFIYYALIVFLASSCMSNKMEVVEPDIDLAFNVVISASTKADDIETEYPMDTPFGVWSYSLPKEKTWSEYNNEAVSIHSQEQVLYDEGSGLWKPQNNTTWVSSENNMSFFAYSPFSRECCFSKDNGICITDYSINEGLQLLFSENIHDKNKVVSNGIVHIPFINALTSVEFNIRSSLPDGTIIRIKQLKVHDIATKGDFYSMPSARWENLEEYEDVVFFQGEKEIGNEPLSVGECIFMIPQAMTPTITLLCDIISGDYILHDQELKADGRMRWNVGKTCTYNLKVTTDLTFIIESSLNE